MPEPHHVAVVVGTRPEAIKVAPLIHELGATTGFTPLTISTGQHLDLLLPMLEALEIPADHSLDLFRPGQGVAELLARAITGLTELFAETGPHAVVVQGDTATALAGALAAFYARIPVVHLEAGLRSGDRQAPWPEESQRDLIGRIADLHLAPTEGARTNLLREGVDPATITVTGNTVVDALHWIVARPAPKHDLLDSVADAERLAVVTVHRREAWGEPLARVGRAIRRLVDADPRLTVAMPLHPNPAVRATVLPEVDGHDRILVAEPPPYPVFAHLLARADIALTDSGGIQEEAPSLGVPVLVLRDKTERPEGVAAGVAELVGTDDDRIVAAAQRILADGQTKRERETHNPYGDGHAAARCVRAIVRLLTAEPLDLADQFVVPT